jgi:hypothetical protein
VIAVPSPNQPLTGKIYDARGWRQFWNHMLPNRCCRHHKRWASPVITRHTVFFTFFFYIITACGLVVKAQMRKQNTRKNICANNIQHANKTQQGKTELLQRIASFPRRFVNLAARCHGSPLFIFSPLPHKNPHTLSTSCPQRGSLT